MIYIAYFIIIIFLILIFIILSILIYESGELYYSEINKITKEQMKKAGLSKEEIEQILNIK
jgi:5-bromo-4-chloroindolyl phosphate hydrolysis protein